MGFLVTECSPVISIVGLFVYLRMAKCFKHWRGYGVGYNQATKMAESVQFELELMFPIDNLTLEFFLKQNEFIWKGITLAPYTITVPEKAFWGITFTYK